jgi:6,7-dimethyl-8-ribityllumazine synthase
MATREKSLSDIEIFGATPISNVKVAIVTASWNNTFTYALRDGAIATLKQLGLRDEDIVLTEVPGGFELPLAAAWTLDSCDAAICIGCVIKGDTPHFEYICAGLTQGIMDLNMRSKKPVVYGVLTVNNEQQAEERCGGIHGNKGVEAAATCVRMLHVKNSLRTH